MDAGVGVFIFSSALTSRFARGNPIQRSGDTGKPSTSSVHRLMSFLGIPPRRLIVLALGFGRLVMVKLLNYQEHVSEYGVHWNFFMTLFSVWVAADLVHQFLRDWSVVPLSLLLLSSYQTWLSAGGLTEFLLGDERTGFLAANKEGVYSLLGYLPLYLLAEQFSRHIIFRPSAEGNKERRPTSPPGSPASFPPGTTKIARDSRALSLGLLLTACCCWGSWALLSRVVQPTSRRLCNSSYVALVLALCASLLLCVLWVEELGCLVGSSHGCSLRSLHLMNRHSLFVFLAANLLTGAVNMSIATIHSSVAVSLAVMMGYSLLVTLSAWVVDALMSRGDDASSPSTPPAD